ncbi:hypothetical protein ACLKA6_002622 [Drosophila palustris]
MRAMTFGISCAPCIAHYVRNKNAESYSKQYPRAYEAIKEAHYVDDYIDSTNSEDEAIEVASKVRLIHQEGGFEIRNWASNSASVLKQLILNGVSSLILLDVLRELAPTPFGEVLSG